MVCGRNYCSFLSRALFSNGRVHAFSFSGWLNVSVRTPVGLRSFCSSGAELELSKRRTGFRVRGLAPRFIITRGWVGEVASGEENPALKTVLLAKPPTGVTPETALHERACRFFAGEFESLWDEHKWENKLPTMKSHARQ